MKSCNHKNICIKCTPSEQSLSVVIVYETKVRVLNVGRGSTEEYHFKTYE